MKEHVVSFVDRPKIDLAFSRRRLAIMIAMATGWLPWGREWQAALPLCSVEDDGAKDRRERPGYILCCGYVLRKPEAQRFVDAGLLKAGPSDKFDRPTLVIGAQGEIWISRYFAQGFRPNGQRDGAPRESVRTPRLAWRIVPPSRSRRPARRPDAAGT